MRRCGLLTTMNRFARLLFALLAPPALIFLVGCQAVPPHEQARLITPAAQFSDNPAFAYETGSLALVEPGSAGSGGAAAAGCTSCR